MNRTQFLLSGGQARGEEMSLKQKSREISMCFQIMTSARKENLRELWESLQRNADPVGGQENLLREGW